MWATLAPSSPLDPSHAGLPPSFLPRSVPPTPPLPRPFRLQELARWTSKPCHGMPSAVIAGLAPICGRRLAQAFQRLELEGKPPRAGPGHLVTAVNWRQLELERRAGQPRPTSWRLAARHGHPSHGHCAPLSFGPAWAVPVTVTVVALRLRCADPVRPGPAAGPTAVTPDHMIRLARAAT